MAISPPSENIHTTIEYLAICYEALLPIEYVEPTLHLDRDNKPEKIVLKWKTKRKGGDYSSMKVLDLKAHFKSLVSSLRSENKMPGGRGQQNVSFPKRKFKDEDQEKISSPNKKFKNTRNFWVGREGADKSEEKFKTEEVLPINPD